MIWTALGYSIAAVLVCGGVFAWIKKILEWRNDRFLDDKIGGFLMKQDYITVQILPPTENQRSLDEMENFYINIANVFTSKSPKDIFTEGKWYENYTFEIHSRGGQIGFFCHMNRNYLPVFRSSLGAHYPGTSVIESQDPFGKWPEDWTGPFGPFVDMYCTDIQLGKSDLFPLKHWKDFQRGNDAPTSDPIAVLIATLEDISPNDYIVVQYILRPDSPSRDGTLKRWKTEFDALRTELATNAVIDQTEAGQVQVLTSKERDLLTMCETKMGGENFNTKIRVAIFSDKPAPVRLLGQVMNFFKQFATDRQFMKPNGDTKTNASDDGTRFGPLGPKFGVWMDGFFWKKEQTYRKQKMYKALVRRSLSKGSDPTFVGAGSMAALLHFPMTSQGADMSMVSRVTTDYGHGSALTVSQPPSNLPI